jgi:parvulin-like peptidyl-prolyl isomerase
VTRAQFEKLIRALGLDADSPNRIRTAVRYPELLAFSQKAIELGIDKDPDFQEKVRYSYLQLLWQAYNFHLVKQARSISDAEVEQLYKTDPEMFEQVDVLRIFIPRERHHPAEELTTPAKIDAVRAADFATMKAKAEEIQRRAAAGEDFAKLADEANRFAGLDESEITDIHVGLVNHSEVPPEYKVVFTLQTGQVSEPVAAPLGWHILKVTARDKMPIEDARRLIESVRQQDAMRAAKSGIQTKFNDAYFNTPGGMETAQSGTK